MLTTIELCAGGGGQALGLEQAGFEHLALFENNKFACSTLRTNRPTWRVIEHDLFEEFPFAKFKGVDLIAGGLPCPPFSEAGLRLGENDERNLFTVGLNVVDEVRPKAVMFENVRGILHPKFKTYVDGLSETLTAMGYVVEWKLHEASNFGVPQYRPRAILVAIRKKYSDRFKWPEGRPTSRTVGKTLKRLMQVNSWRHAEKWSESANSIAPTIVGGSAKHGGPDLGPTRTKNAWDLLHVDGWRIADDAPSFDFVGKPQLTTTMVARLQGFPADWRFSGKKTNVYRQIGNALPPQVANAVGTSLFRALS